MTRTMTDKIWLAKRIHIHKKKSENNDQENWIEWLQRNCFKWKEQCVRYFRKWCKITDKGPLI